MNHSQHSDKWRLVPDLRLHRKTWDSQCVLYNADSGTTHCLDEVASTVLSILQQDVCDIQQLADQVARSYESQSDEELLRYLDALLQQLVQLELVERLPLGPGGKDAKTSRSAAAKGGERH